LQRQSEAVARDVEFNWNCQSAIALDLSRTMPEAPAEKNDPLRRGQITIRLITQQQTRWMYTDEPSSSNT